MAVIASLAPLAVAQAPEYSLRFLGDYQLGARSFARGVNNFDVVVGWGEDRNSFLETIDRAYWWNVGSSQTALQRLPGLDPDGGSQAYAINDGIFETIVGAAQTSRGGPWVAVKWVGRSSPVTLLQSTGVSSVALSVNEAGIAVGWEKFDVGTDAVRAFLRRPLDSDRILLPPLVANRGSRACGIDDANTVVGTAQDGAGVWHAVRWTADGNGNYATPEILSMPAGYSAAEARSINSAGQIVGFFRHTAFGVDRAFVRNSGGGVVDPGDLDPNSNATVRAWAINANGVVTGMSSISTQSGTIYRPFVIKNGQMFGVQQNDAPGYAFNMEVAYGINDSPATGADEPTLAGDGLSKTGSISYAVAARAVTGGGGQTGLPIGGVKVTGPNNNVETSEIGPGDSVDVFIQLSYARLDDWAGGATDGSISALLDGQSTTIPGVTGPITVGRQQYQSARLRYTAPEGDAGKVFTFQSSFPGYLANNPTLTVRRLPATVTVDSGLTGRLGQEATLSATVRRNGNPIAGARLSFQVEGLPKVISGPTGADGRASVQYVIDGSVGVGTKSVRAEIEDLGSYPRYTGVGQGTIEVSSSTTLIAADADGWRGDLVTLYARLTDAGAKPVPGQFLTFEVATDSTPFVAVGITDTTGVARVPYQVPYYRTLVNRTITVRYAGSGQYDANIATATLRLQGRLGDLRIEGQFTSSTPTDALWTAQGGIRWDLSVGEAAVTTGPTSDQSGSTQFLLFSGYWRTFFFGTYPWWSQPTIRRRVDP